MHDNDAAGHLQSDADQRIADLGLPPRSGTFASGGLGLVVILLSILIVTGRV